MGQKQSTPTAQARAERAQYLARNGDLVRAELAEEASATAEKPLN
jgi:hypothetical protein